jgi:glucose-6-phosphate isomerase
MTLFDDLRDHRARHESRRILDLFDDPGRAEAFSTRADGMLFDYSKTHLDAEAMDLLLALAEAADVAGKREAMFSGAKINETEGRAVLHTALRAPGGPILVDGRRMSCRACWKTRARMEAFAMDVRSGAIAGAGGPYTDVVNIGIGGSDLGPAMATLALAPYHDGPRVHYVSNVDGAHIHDTLKGLDPRRTLVIVASKTFTTIETMTNAETARDWMAKAVDDPASQFAALSSATDRTAAFGIDPSRVFGFEDWVGGRYSLWGPIGLSLMLAVGPEDFARFPCRGARDGRAFPRGGNGRKSARPAGAGGDLAQPDCGHATRAVLPYDQRLSRLPAYLQQLEMESNGKRVAMDGAIWRRTPAPSSGASRARTGSMPSTS